VPVASWSWDAAGEKLLSVYAELAGVTTIDVTEPVTPEAIAR
jgi:hypothetical protein